MSVSEHVLEDHSNGCPYDRRDDWRQCPICEGGLANCVVCNGAEGSLPTECPGEPMHAEVSQAVYDEELDFENGEWLRQPAVHWRRRVPDE